MRLLDNCGTCGVEVQVADGEQVTVTVSGTGTPSSRLTILCAKEGLGVTIPSEVTLGEYIRKKMTAFCSMACLLKFVETATAKQIVSNRLGVSTDTDEDRDIRDAFCTVLEQPFKKDQITKALQEMKEAKRRLDEEQKKVDATFRPTGLLK